MRASILALVAALTPTAALAQLDLAEHERGPTHVSAQSGNGGLTVGVAPRGEVTVLGWPSPSFSDQLDYATAARPDARTLPHLGARDDEGMFTGLRVGGGDDPRTTWLRDEGWAHEQRYRSDHSAFVEQRATHAELGLEVVEELGVAADRDVLVRRVTVSRTADSPVEALDLVFFANLAPTARHDAAHPEADWADDDANDYAAFWDPQLGAAIHYAPDGDAPPRVQDVLELMLALSRNFAVDDWSDWVDGVRGEARRPTSAGVFAALGGSTAPDAFQVGDDDGAECSYARGWTWRPESAFDQSEAGAWGSSPVAGCHANVALAWSHDFGPAGAEASWTSEVYVALGQTYDDAADGLLAARAEGAATIMDATDADNQAWLDSLDLPVGLGPGVEGFARRALISLRQGTDRASGAVVSSIATQPAGRSTEPRQAAWIDYALATAGARDAATSQQRFLTDLQELGDASGLLPAGAWRADYFTDGLPHEGSDFDLEQVGPWLWSYTAHAWLAPNDTARRAALAGPWPQIAAAADLLSTCVDDTHPALEPGDGDGPAWLPLLLALRDGTVPDAGARAAALDAGDFDSLRPCDAFAGSALDATLSARLGLVAAVRAARLLCVDEPRVTYWEERASELAAVALALYYDEDAAAWDGQGCLLLWPEPLELLPMHHELFSSAATPEDRAMDVATWIERSLDDQAQVALGRLRAAVIRDSEGASAAPLDLLGLARWMQGDRRPEGRLAGDELARLLRSMTGDLSTEGTAHLGSVWVNVDDDGDGTLDRSEQRVDVPHLGAAALTWLAAMALDDPARLDAVEGVELEPQCPVGDEPDLKEPMITCDGCKSSVGGAAPAGLLPLLALLGLPLRRRR